MTMLRAGGLLDVLTSLSDCRHKTVERITERRISDFWGFVYVLDGFPQRDYVLWVFMCPTTVSLFCDHLHCTDYHAEDYHAPSLPPRAITPVYTVITPELSRSTTHVHRVITPAISNSYFVVYLSPAFTPPVLLIYTTTGAPHVPTYLVLHNEPSPLDCGQKHIVPVY